ALTTADRLFTRVGGYGKSGAGQTVIPQFFYYPTNDPNGSPVIMATPTSFGWSNPVFPDVSQAFGVVGLPQSTGLRPEAKVPEVFDNANHPCVPAVIGEPFQVLAPGLTERQTDTSLWRAISVSLDSEDPMHPPFSSEYANTTVATRAHQDVDG